jgi:hypothetical protein
MILAGKFVYFFLFIVQGISLGTINNTDMYSGIPAAWPLPGMPCWFWIFIPKSHHQINIFNDSQFAPLVIRPMPIRPKPWSIRPTLHILISL